MRKLLRSVARHKMEKEGNVNINKRFTMPDKTGLPKKFPSFFADNWRKYANAPKKLDGNGVPVKKQGW